MRLVDEEAHLPLALEAALNLVPIPPLVTRHPAIDKIGGRATRSHGNSTFGKQVILVVATSTVMVIARHDEAEGD